MAIESMTGFARSTGASGPWRFTWELRSVNGKSLDVKARLAPPLEDLLEEVRRRVGQAVRRGTIQIGLALVREGGRSSARIDEELLEHLIAATRAVAARTGAPVPGMDALLGIRGVVEVVEAEHDADAMTALRRDVLAGLDLALADLTAARAGEGAALDHLIAAQMNAIGDLVRRADICPARSPEAIRARLAGQIAALTDIASGLDGPRLHQEALLMAAKADIREELDRLTAHVGAVRDLLREGGAVGRRLDFLAQEFSREANTLCAKSGDVTLTAIGLELKVVVDQYREQVQNVA